MAQTVGRIRAEKRLVVDGWDGHVTLSYAHCVEAPGTPCVRLHGHSGAVSIEVNGALGDDGFVIDFGALKRRARFVVDQLDHHTLVAKRQVTSVRNGVCAFRQSGKNYQIPAEDAMILPIPQTTAEELSAYVLHELVNGLKPPGIQLALRKSIRTISVGWHEGPGTPVWSTWERTRGGTYVIAIDRKAQERGR
jgi:6-pyruvoyltetrahydropterin/6-carboxytetrahydropterin synthase